MAYDIMMIGKKIKVDLQNSGVVVPENYAVDNAVKSAYLALLNAKRPIIGVCTEDSIKNSLLDMIIQGLNPAKKQCSFIAYGNKLTCHRDYFGSIMLAKRVDPDINVIRSEVIYKGDKYKIRVVNGMREVYAHEPQITGEEIEGAYAIAIDHNNNPLHTDIMSMKEINISWSKSRSKEKSVQKEFSYEMAQRTVLQRLCKRIINTSDDEQLLKAAKATDEDRYEAEEIKIIAEENTNTKVLDFPQDDHTEYHSVVSNHVEEPEVTPEPEESEFSKIESEIGSVEKPSKPNWAV